MIHGFFLILGVFMLIWGVVICGFLISASIKAGKAIWLITAPAIVIVVVLMINFACHIYHVPQEVIPHQRQIVSGIDWTLRVAAVPLVLIKLLEVWKKRRNKGSAAQLRREAERHDRD